MQMSFRMKTQNKVEKNSKRTISKKMSGDNVNKKNLGCSTNVIHHYAHVNTAPYNVN